MYLQGWFKDCEIHVCTGRWIHAIRFNFHILFMQTFTNVTTTFNFYRAMLAQSAVMRLHVVRLSVCPSVTIRYRDHIDSNSSKRPNAPSFQIRSGWNWTELFFKYIRISEKNLHKKHVLRVTLLRVGYNVFARSRRIKGQMFVLRKVGIHAICCATHGYLSIRHNISNSNVQP